MNDIDALRRETERLCALTLARVNPYQVVDDMRRHMERLQAALDESQSDLARQRSDVNRLTAWLIRIEGGDSPCTDESQLRQWAYEAIALRKPAP